MKDLFITKSTLFTECPYHFPSSRYLRLSAAGYDENRVFPYIIPPIKMGLKTAWIVKIFTVNTVRSCFWWFFMYFHVLKLIKPQNLARLSDFGKYLGIIDQFLVKTAPGASNACKTEFWKQLRYIRSQVLHILLSWFLVCRHFGGLKKFVCWEIFKKGPKRSKSGEKTCCQSFKFLYSFINSK